MSGGDFWSRRQAGVAAELAADQRAQVEAQAVARDAEVAEQSDEEILAALELPEPESLGEGDDFKVFLTDQVPARIKTRALRHLWRANPVLACVDGLVDYGEDFTDAACVIEGMQTAYQVGKGMTKHVEALAKDEMAEVEADKAGAAAEVETATEPTVEIAAEEAETAGVSAALSAEGAADVPETSAAVALAAAQSELESDSLDPAEPQITPAPRRMRFSYEGAQT